MVVDGTGVGAPVVDMLRAAGLGCEITAVSITGGDRESRRGVPKRDLIARVQLALEKGELRIAAHEERGRTGAGAAGYADDRERWNGRGGTWRA